MVRSLSKTLTPLSTITTITTTTTSTSSRLSNYRHRSSPPETDERIALKKLEDAIHQIIVKKSEPLWLPFLPGASYWVPPKSKSRGFAQVVGKLASNPAGLIMNTDPDLLVSSSSYGWPSSAHFFKGTSDSQMERDETSKHTSKSEDDEK